MGSEAPRLDTPRGVVRESGALVLIWLAAVLPMTVLVWIIAPIWMRASADLPGLVFWRCVVVGLIWQTVLSVWVLKREGVDLSWPALRERLWLGPPHWPGGNSPAPPAFFLIPFLFMAGWFGDYAIDAWFRSSWFGAWVYEFAPAHAFIENLASAGLKGRWDVLVLALVSSLFNYVLGEALLFHGVLLPRMARVWGRWAFLGNAVLFAGYHVHKFWMLPALIPSCIAYALPAQVFRSNWLALIIHGLEGVILIWIMFGLVSGAL